MKNKLYFWAIGLTLLFTSARSYSADQAMHGYVGALGGYSKWNVTQTTGRIGFGATAAFRVLGHFGFGGYFLMNSKVETAGTYGLTLYGGELNYFIPTSSWIFRFGGRCGLSKMKINTSVTSDSKISYGPVASLDYRLGKNFSVGVEASMFFFPIFTGGATTNSASNLFNTMAALKFWF